MVTRLVLGSDGGGLGMFEEMAERRGDLLVVDPDPGRVEQLRNRKIDAQQGDVTEISTLRELHEQPDIVLVFGSDPSQNISAVTVARQVFPSAYLLAAPGTDATAANRATLESGADEVISVGAALVDLLETMVDDETLDRIRSLRETFRGFDGHLGIFMHDNPDPDAIASAVALTEIAQYFDVEATPCYFGEITHQENRAFVNLLEYDLRNVDPEEELSFAHYALVDHSGPGINDRLAPETPIALILDHHSFSSEVTADFVDLRPTVGATSTILVDYLRGFDVDVTPEIATGLLYGIRTDTRDFARNVTVQDFQAAAFLLTLARPEVLQRVESPSVSPETMDIIGRAIRNRQVRRNVLSTCVGPTSDRDAIAQAADRLLNLEHIDVVFVFGYRDGRIVLSGRSRGVSVNLGDVLREAFGDLGSAGGHGNMAGAQIPMGIFESVPAEAESDFTEMIEDVVNGRLFEALDPEEIEE